MPAMTSPLIALRFSGRLMVIQSAEARFSMMTMLLSVMGAPCCYRCKRSEAIQSAASKDWIASELTLLAMTTGTLKDHPESKAALRPKSRFRYRRRLLHPDLVVVEGSAPVRSNRFGAREHIDAS